MEAVVSRVNGAALDTLDRPVVRFRAARLQYQFINSFIFSVTPSNWATIGLPFVAAHINAGMEHKYCFGELSDEWISPTGRRCESLKLL